MGAAKLLIEKNEIVSEEISSTDLSPGAVELDARWRGSVRTIDQGRGSAQ